MAKRYRVIGPNRVFEHAPGAEFERDLTDAERSLLGVHLSQVEAQPPALQARSKKAARKRRAENPTPQSEE